MLDECAAGKILAAFPAFTSEHKISAGIASGADSVSEADDLEGHFMFGDPADLLPFE